MRSISTSQLRRFSSLATPLLLFAAIAMFPASSMAAIGFDGGTVSADYNWPTLGTVYIPSGPAVVGPGVEFTGIGGSNYPNVDISDTNIYITYPGGWGLAGSGTFDGWVISDLSNTIPQIVGASLAGSDIPGMNSSFISFDNDHVYVDTLGLLGWAAGSFISVDVEFAAVPEPTSIIVWSVLGIAGVVAYRRRRKAA